MSVRYDDKFHLCEKSIKFDIPENVKTPWFDSTEGVPVQLNYFDGSMSDAVFMTARNCPKICAYEFFGNKVSFSKMILQIEETAKALKAQGVKVGDRVTICMPNTPQAIIMFYAINRIGAVANMIHPLSAEEEIVEYINNSNSKICLTLLQFYEKFENIRSRINLQKLIVCDITDGLKGLKKILFPLLRRGVKKLPKNDFALKWCHFIKRGKSYTGAYVHRGKAEDLAVILYSGGTSGKTKGVLLSNLNFNACAMQTGVSGNGIEVGCKCLAMMPIFHGFGLGVCIHTMLYWGVTAILVPQFNHKTFLKLLLKYRPNYVAGVPTLYEALLRLPNADKLDFSSIKGIFSGGDSLSVELKRKIDLFLKEHGSSEQIREGYGLTETVTACCLTPRYTYREGSIGIPFPDTYMKIVKPETDEELPYGEIGEICIHGPSLMQGYMNNEQETSDTLRKHGDGLVWLHTGDLGTMDKDGFIYFKQRLKRMIVTNGYNVYPSQVENAIDSLDFVATCTVVGVKDDIRIQKVKAFVILKEGVAKSDETKTEIKGRCEKLLPKYALPREIDFVDALPKTLVGKVAYTKLENM